MSTVKFVECVPVDITNHGPYFYYQPDKGWKWLQKICFDILYWIGATKEFPTTKDGVPCVNGVERCINLEDITDLIFQQYMSIIEKHGVKPTTVLIGAEQVKNIEKAEIASIIEQFGHAIYGLAEPTLIKVGSYEFKYKGLDIKIIAWLDGVIVY